MSRLLVTGAGGLVGGALARGLSHEGFEVRATGRRPTVDALPCAFDICDLCDAKGVEALFRTGVNVVIHAAARIRSDSMDRAPFVRDNILATATLADAARRAGVGIFIFISTISVYSGDGPFSEASRAEPLDAYGWSKRAAENVCKASLGASAIVLRLGGVHGPPRLSGALHAFVEQARGGRDIIVDEPETRFSPTFLDDVIAGVAKIARSRPFPSCLFNLAIAETPAYREVAERIRTLAGSTSAITSPALPRVRNRTLDVSRIRNELGFVPQTLDVHLRRLIARGARAEA